ncbi:MAG TPA: cytochrome c biogenesis protein CcsA, partial [Aestuariivirga sp.]|nr:cytochrome c biogenesis protein CcsA [Aestuariivirga sp.]
MTRVTQTIQTYANPARFLGIANAVLPSIWAALLCLLGVGLYGALVAAPADYQQGETVRIMYVHVPAAWMALLVYSVMALASASAMIFRHPLADAAAKTAAPIGAVFCFLALATGSLWGKPTWGAWWVWDARLTSMFVLFLFYLGYISIWQSIDEPHRAALIARIVALIGF